MFVFLSKFLPLLVYPLGIACLLIIFALIFRRKTRLQNLLLLLAIVILWLGSNRWVSYSMARSLEWRYLPQAEIPSADVIVVLGGGTEPMLFPRPTVEVNSAGDRVLYAASLYHAGKAPNLLLSGGVITWLNETSTTPAEDMQALLSTLNVPAEAVWIQNRSQNTHEDAAYSSQILSEKGIQRIILVTSAMHMPRSVALFQKLGIEVIPAPTDFTVTQQGWENLVQGSFSTHLINLFPAAGNLSLTTNVLKEYIGLLTYRLQGWL